MSVGKGPGLQRDIISRPGTTESALRDRSQVPRER
jgi:hypothetical protein